MLAIRMQRIGRKGVAQFRVVVQDAHRSPKRGKVVAQLGSYNPHTKEVTLDKDKAQTYLNNGAQPSDRIISLFSTEGIKLPKWVAKPAKKEGKLKNPDKLRKNRPAEEKPAESSEPEATVSEVPAKEEPEAQEPVEKPAEAAEAKTDEVQVDLPEPEV